MLEETTCSVQTYLRQKVQRRFSSCNIITCRSLKNSGSWNEIIRVYYIYLFHKPHLALQIPQPLKSYINASVLKICVWISVFRRKKTGWNFFLRFWDMESHFWDTAAYIPADRDYRDYISSKSFPNILWISNYKKQNLYLSVISVWTESRIPRNPKKKGKFQSILLTQTLSACCLPLTISFVSSQILML